MKRRTWENENENVHEIVDVVGWTGYQKKKKYEAIKFAKRIQYSIDH